MILGKVMRVCCSQKRAGKLQPFKYAPRANARNNHNSSNTKEKETGQRQQSKSANAARAAQSQAFNSLEQVFKATDILLHNGGFGFIAVDLSSIDEARLRKVPLTTWFRFARVADDTQTALVFLTSAPIGCSFVRLKFNISGGSVSWSKSETDDIGKCCVPASLNPTADKSNSQLHQSHQASDSYLSFMGVDTALKAVQPGDVASVHEGYRAIEEHNSLFHMNMLTRLQSEIEVVRNKQPIQQVRARL